MGNALGRTSGITEQDRAILELKVQRDKLQHYQLKAILQHEQLVARHHLVRGDKKRALLALKKRRYQEGLLEKTDAQLLNLEELTYSIEFAAVQRQVIEGIRNGNRVLIEIQKELSLDAVDQLMEETAGALAYQKEVEEAITERLTSEELEDIEKELDAMVKAEEEAALADESCTSPQKTSTPTKQLSTEEQLVMAPSIPDTKLTLSEEAITRNEWAELEAEYGQTRGNLIYQA
ncbi:vacuolar protein sorting-associated protein 20-like protein [Syncephalis plumigaleata]|nr:vacuolar protein sorting-associated protein 20-like protein [Syncephalis plumigaleata]